jgi:hypothetical protein
MAEDEKREDKIFNNRYNQGDGLKDPDEYEYNKGIQVDVSYSKDYLNDIYDYENSVEYQIFFDHIFNMIENDTELKDLIDDKDGTRNKFNKDEINFLFERILTSLDSSLEYETFSSSIYILEAISNVTAMDYKKIFDFLDYSHKELLLSELNKKYKFLDWKMNKNNKMF